MDKRRANPAEPVAVYAEESVHDRRRRLAHQQQRVQASSDPIQRVSNDSIQPPQGMFAGNRLNLGENIPNRSMEQAANQQQNEELLTVRFVIHHEHDDRAAVLQQILLNHEALLRHTMKAVLDFQYTHVLGNNLGSAPSKDANNRMISFENDRDYGLMRDIRMREPPNTKEQQQNPGGPAAENAAALILQQPFHYYFLPPFIDFEIIGGYSPNDWRFFANRSSFETVQVQVDIASPQKRQQRSEEKTRRLQHEYSRCSNRRAFELAQINNLLRCFDFFNTKTFDLKILSEVSRGLDFAKCFLAGENVRKRSVRLSGNQQLDPITFISIDVIRMVLSGDPEDAELQGDEGLLRLIGIDRILPKLREAALGFCTPNDKDVSRGLLMYGPPGSGKTTVLERLCFAIGFFLVCTPLNAADFERGYKGDSGAMIRALAMRASIIPWQACVSAIDEIDGIAGSGRSDVRGMILSYVGGLQNVGNLFLFGGTNFIDQMDKAVLRRLTEKLFMGPVDHDGRVAWISQAFPNLPEKTIDYLAAWTLNFSHDGMRRILKKIKTKMEYEDRDIFQDNDKVRESIRETLAAFVKSEGIFLSAFIVPDLYPIRAIDAAYAAAPLLRTHFIYQHLAVDHTNRAVVRVRRSDARDDGVYLETEKMLRQTALVVRLADLLVQISTRDVFDTAASLLSEENVALLEQIPQIFRQVTKADTFWTVPLAEAVAVEHNFLANAARLSSGFLSALKRRFSTRTQRGHVKIDGLSLDIGITEREVLSATLTACLRQRVSALHVFDGSFLAREGAERDESKLIALLRSHMDELLQSDSSALVIFNLDDLARITRRYGEMKAGEAVNPQIGPKGNNGRSGVTIEIGYPHLLQYIFQIFSHPRFRDPSAYFLRNAGTGDVKIMLIVRDPFLVYRLREETGWEVSYEGEENLANYKKREEDKAKCLRDGEAFTEAGNKDDSCKRHTMGAVIFNESAKPTKTGDETEAHYHIEDVQSLTAFGFGNNNVGMAIFAKFANLQDTAEVNAQLAALQVDPTLASEGEVYEAVRNGKLSPDQVGWLCCLLKKGVGGFVDPHAYCKHLRRPAQQQQPQQ